MLWALIVVPMALFLLPRLARRRREPSGFVPYGTVSILRLELDPRRARGVRLGPSGSVLPDTLKYAGLALVVAGAVALAMESVRFGLP
jgi:hypothetical protein